MSGIIRSRIAPTPSGYLHIGNAFNFLLTEALVKQARGFLRLRIDDLDAARVRDEYLDDIFESLSWMGISPAEGPDSRDDHNRNFAQHYRLNQYEQLLQQLADKGLVFACDCSRKDIASHSDDGQYSGACLHRKLPLDSPDVAWRMITPPEEPDIVFRDEIRGVQAVSLWNVQRHFMVRRRDGVPAYHLASLCDDVSYGVNLIVRGQDLLSSTAAQLYLARALGLNDFMQSRFYHHPLLKDDVGEKLSKSAGSSSLRAMRQAGFTAAQLRQQAAGWYAAFLP